jgi:hypothetical protein
MHILNFGNLNLDTFQKSSLRQPARTFMELKRRTRKCQLVAPQFDFLSWKETQRRVQHGRLVCKGRTIAKGRRNFEPF